MARKRKVIEFESESRQQLEAVRALLGQPVPLSSRYVRGTRPILEAIVGDLATIRYPNGVVMTGVPLRDLVDDSGYWKT